MLPHIDDILGSGISWNMLAFDICEAHYIYAMDYGDYERIARLRKMQFKCSPMITKREHLSPEGQAIYDNLVDTLS